MANASSYTFRIGSGNCKDEKAIAKGLVNEIKSSAASVIAEVPYFNSEYSWEVIYKDSKGKVIGHSAIYHFSTVAPVYNDSTKFRVRVITDNYKDKGLHFFLDHAGGLFDLGGKGKWFLPLDMSNADNKGAVSNMKLTPEHTISMIKNEQAYEIDHAGNILWKAPGGTNDTPCRYHHEFIRRPNGNYVTLRWENVYMKIPERFVDKTRPDPMAEMRSDGFYKLIEFSVIEEHDAKGKVIWDWHSGDAFSDDDLFGKRMADGRYLTITHLNAFYIDEKQQAIYAGFKERSLIVKVAYPGRQVLGRFDGVAGEGFNFFKQHCISKCNDSTLLVFSNNIGKPLNTMGSILDADETRIRKVSSVVMLKEGRDNSLTKEWEFFCDVDDHVEPASYRGGNVTELPDGNLFICMGVSPRILIVSKDKKVLYNAVAEEWSDGEQKWIPFVQYRATPVSPKDLDELILTSIPHD